MNIKLTRLNKFIICTIGLFSIFSLSAVNFNIQNVETLATDPIQVEGHYAKAKADSVSDNITFVLAENTAPQDSTKYKTSGGSLKVLRANGTTNTVADNIEAITKISPTEYRIASSAFSDVGALSVGDAVILDGNFVREDYSLHIKESKLYVSATNLIVTIPHKLINISSYLENVQASVNVDAGHNWAFLLWPTELPTTAFLQTLTDPDTKADRDGYYPTSVNCIYVDGVARANCQKDALRRRDDWGNEIYVNASQQLGTDNPEVGTLVVFDGIFDYRNYLDGKHQINPNVVLDTGETLGIEINLLALLKVGAGKDDYKRVDFKSYLLEQFSTLYNSDLYEPDLYEEISGIHNQLMQDIQPLNTAKNIYEVYNTAAAIMEGKTLSEDGFDSFKARYLKELNDYVDFENYYEADVETINQYISECVETFETAATTRDVVNAVAYAKSRINSVKTRATKMEDAVLKLADGYEKFLAPYDNVTLNDLSLGNSQVFHVDKNARGEDINTNKEEKNQHNIFVPNQNNKYGNVTFNFKYKASEKPTAGSNVVVVLRGIKYGGYKFNIDTESGGFMFKRTFGNTDDSFSGGSYIFTDPNHEYKVSASAIDLIEGNKTWIRLVVDGAERLNKIVDSLSICINPRVSLSNNDDVTSTGTGIATISNYYPTEGSSLSPIYCGRFGSEPGHKDNSKTIFLSSKTNDLKSDSNGCDSYALSETNIKLVRDEEEFVIGRTDIPILGKYGDNSYQLYLSELFTDDTDDIDTLYPGDIVVISGCFAYFDEDNAEKVLFEIGSSSFVFKGKRRPWVVNTSLEEAKDDASKQFNYYCSDAFQNIYDNESKRSINNLVEGATKLVSAADTVERVEQILDRLSLMVDQVKTAFEKYQDKVLSAIDSYKKDIYSSYRQDELYSIISIKDEATKFIKNSSSIEEIDQLFADAKANIDSVLTDEEMAQNELNEAIYEQLTEIKNRYAVLIKAATNSEEVAKLNSETSTAIEKVKAAKTIDEARSEGNSYLSSHPLAKEKNNTPILIIVACSAGVLLLGAGVSIFFIIRKRKKAKLN